VTTKTRHAWHGIKPLLSGQTNVISTKGTRICVGKELKKCRVTSAKSLLSDRLRFEEGLDSGSLKTREWMTTEQAAEYLGLSVGALRNMASNGQVPYHKLGRRNRYNVVELRQLLLSQKRGGCHGS